MDLLVSLKTSGNILVCNRRRVSCSQIVSQITICSLACDERHTAVFLLMKGPDETTSPIKMSFFENLNLSIHIPYLVMIICVLQVDFWSLSV